MKRILVVDDDENLRMVLLQTLESCSYEVVQAESGHAALEILKDQTFDLVITDLMMPGIKGIELISEARKLYADLGFLVISAYGTIETAVEAMQKGAYDFITKPFSISHIESRVERFFEYHDLQEENKKLRRQLQSYKLDTQIIGQSKATKDVLYHVDVVAKSDATVFIRGDSGTGKELIAQAIHDNSNRSDKPFLKINCAAVPETLFESTLFGHERGSFSGAYKSQKGIFEECDGGTLLLDEISEIPYNMQAKLLRVLQEMRIIRVGSTAEIPIDVRVIATSNKEINELIEAGKFREDLFFRLNVFPIQVPALRERKDDIPLLVDYFLKKLQKKYKYNHKTIDPIVLEKMSTHDWPGNIRQLEHIIERAVLFSAKSEYIGDSHIVYENESSGQNGDGEITGPLTTLADMEKKMIYAALKETGNHRAKAANLLGITVRTLRNKLHQFEDEK